MQRDIVVEVVYSMVSEFSLTEEDKVELVQLESEMSRRLVIHNGSGKLMYMRNGVLTFTTRKTMGAGKEKNERQMLAVRGVPQ